MWFHISSQKKKKKKLLSSPFVSLLWNIFSTQVFPCLQKYSETRLLFYFLKIIKTTESIYIAAKIIWKKKKKIESERESVRFWKVSFYKFSPLYSSLSVSLHSSLSLSPSLSVLYSYNNFETFSPHKFFPVCRNTQKQDFFSTF